MYKYFCKIDELRIDTIILHGYGATWMLTLFFKQIPNRDVFFPHTEKLW